MLILDHSSGSFGPQPGGRMVLPCVEEVYYDKVSGVESKATNLTAAGGRQKGPGSRTFYKGFTTPQEHH